jgi:hypothetical protein
MVRPTWKQQETEMYTTEKLQQTAEIRSLTDAELDVVNGGSPALPIILAAWIGFNFAASGVFDAIDWQAMARQL